MGFLIHSRLCTLGSTSTFQTIIILNFALGSWGNLGPSLMFHVCQLTDTIKIEIKSECFKILSAGQRVTTALADPALVSSVSIIGVFSMVFCFIPYSSWGRGTALEKWKGESGTEEEKAIKITAHTDVSHKP